MIIAGIDPSLVGTGIVKLKDGKVVEQKLIKSKPVGNKPIDELKRLLKIVEEIPLKGVDMAVVEGIAYGIRRTSSLSQLSGLNYLIRKKCYEQNIPFIIVAATTNKKFCTGSGKGEKNQMMLSVYKKWGFSPANDDLSDAFSLAKVGEALSNENRDKLLKYENEVINLLKRQL